MPGGLVQLAAIGVQDIFLISSPEVTFFKLVYRRHTNFSFEPIGQNFLTRPDFGRRSTCTIARAGDLIYHSYIVIDLPAIPTFINSDGMVDNLSKAAWARKIGYALIKSVEMEIGGQSIDKQYGDWLAIYSELTGPGPPNQKGLNNMIGNIPELFEFSNGKNTFRLFVPLIFWFNRQNGLALPLVSMQYSEVKINLEIQPINDVLILAPTNSILIKDDVVTFIPFEYIEQIVNGQVVTGMFISFDFDTKTLYYVKECDTFAFQGPVNNTVIVNQTVNAADIEAAILNKSSQALVIFGLTSGGVAFPQDNAVEQAIAPQLTQTLSLANCFLLIDYIYLDTDERLRFANASHEYLIEQLEFTGTVPIMSNIAKIQLQLNHPCKSVIFVVQLDCIRNGNFHDTFNYTNSPVRDLVTGELVGTNNVLKAQILLNGLGRFSIRPGTYFDWVQSYQNYTYAQEEGINVYSFALHPEDIQPSASCNMSKIDNVFLQITTDPIINATTTANVLYYSVNYNILRIINGLAGVTYIT